LLTEIGRRLGMLFGSAAMLVTILVGLFSHGNIATVAIYGLAAGILCLRTVFGTPVCFARETASSQACLWRALPYRKQWLPFSRQGGVGSASVSESRI